VDAPALTFGNHRTTFLITIQGRTMPQLRTIRSLAICLSAIAFTTQASAQSITTGTLHLRTPQPATVSLTLPTAGVTGYTLQLPATAGVAGQALTIQNVSGSTATLEWRNSSFWELTGTAITTGGTAANEQYLGTSNAQDLVLASNASEGIRLVGVAGPAQGFIGIGTAAPKAPVDIARTVLLSNTGVATELRFAEPSAGGSNYTAFRAGQQNADVTYTLPDAAPASDGMVLTGSTSGQLTWTKPLQSIARGIFIPVVGQYIHVIPIGSDITTGSIPVLTMVNPPGTTIGISITGIDDVNDTITVETSVPLGAADRICWMMVHPN
jgi:hypothetical protein